MRRSKLSVLTFLLLAGCRADPNFFQYQSVQDSRVTLSGLTNPTPIPTPTSAPELTCAVTTSTPVTSGQSASIAFAVASDQTVQNFTVDAPVGTSPTLFQNSLSSSSAGPNAVNFMAPSGLTAELDVNVTAHAQSGLTASCAVRILPAGSLGGKDDGNTDGLVGNVYDLNGMSPLPLLIPDFSKLTAVLTIVAPNLNVPNENYTVGFPGVPNLNQYFAIRFLGVITVPTTGTYQFELNSDDGSNLYIDGQQVVNDDGTHSVQAAYGSVTLAAGDHTVDVDYMQGPPTEIAMMWSWIPPGATSNQYQIVPASVLHRPGYSSGH